MYDKMESLERKTTESQYQKPNNGNLSHNEGLLISEKGKLKRPHILICQFFGFIDAVYLHILRLVLYKVRRWHVDVE